MTQISAVIRSNDAITQWQEGNNTFFVTYNDAGKPALIQSKAGRWPAETCSFEYDVNGVFTNIIGNLKTLLLPLFIAQATSSSLTATGQTNLDAGTVSLPGLVLEGDVDSGLYRIGANNYGVAMNGAKVLDISTAGLGVTGTISVTDAAKFATGSAATPSITFTGDPDTGLISSAANALGFVTGGVEKWMINSSGSFNPITDNTYDIGGATKPRDITAGRAIQGVNVISTAAAPASATATGTAGEIRSAAGFLYICTATNTWERVATATWA